MTTAPIDLADVPPKPNDERLATLVSLGEALQLVVDRLARILAERAAGALGCHQKCRFDGDDE
jgi:hypothetical protein